MRMHQIKPDVSSKFKWLNPDNLIHLNGKHITYCSSLASEKCSLLDNLLANLPFSLFVRPLTRGCCSLLEYVYTTSIQLNRPVDESNMKTGFASDHDDCTTHLNGLYYSSRSDIRIVRSDFRSIHKIFVLAISEFANIIDLIVCGGGVYTLMKRTKTIKARVGVCYREGDKITPWL